MAYIKKNQDPRPWEVKPERKAQAGRKVDNSKFYNLHKWTTQAKADKKKNPFCVECVKRALQQLVMSDQTITPRALILDVYYKVDAAKRGLKNIVVGFEQAPSVLAGAVVEKGAVTDHIKPYQPGDDFWNKENWQTLCTPHHNSKSGKERHQKNK